MLTVRLAVCQAMQGDVSESKSHSLATAVAHGYKGPDHKLGANIEARSSLNTAPGQATAATADYYAQAAAPKTATAKTDDAWLNTEQHSAPSTGTKDT